MIKYSLLSAIMVVALSACSTFSTQQIFNQPNNLLFNNKKLNTLPISVQRDERLCEDDKPDDQKCPIKFYIDDFKAGDFYINNTTTYYLKPNEYELTVKNCKEECKTSHIKINVGEHLPLVTLILSIDHEGKPFIINKK